MINGALSTGTVEEWCQRYEIDPERILGWKIWYTDGTVYSSAEREADDLPDDEVQVVKVYHHLKGDGDHIYTLRFIGNDPYWLPGATRSKRGTWVSDEEHNRFHKESGSVGWP